VFGFKGFREYAGWHALYLTNFVSSQDHADLAYSAHFWTLAVEEQFYLVWPALVMLLSPRALVYSTILLCLVSPLYRILPDYMGFPRSVFPTSLLPAQLDYLCTGAIIALATAFSRPIAQRRLEKCLLLAGITGFFCLTSVHNSLGWLNHSCLAMVCGGLVSHASHGIGGIPGVILRSKPLLKIGGVSYGIYVIHMVAPAIWEWIFWSSPIPMYRVLARLGLPADIFDNSYLRLLPYLSITILLAALSWIVIESPFLKLKTYFPYRQGTRRVGNT
jgi:peptidoglycan/LPS O-acetylase OafA/YrhL